MWPQRRLQEKIVGQLRFLASGLTSSSGSSSTNTAVRGTGTSLVTGTTTHGHWSPPPLVNQVINGASHIADILPQIVAQGASYSSFTLDIKH
ncbi:Hypothetical predicted protein [Drosophila guanche]|uniref:Uncharacterized protein n=1 Tax=Drosophila guanche TaxID=7266 RepID=A0A3B0KJ19_DROGU|nr:Hypothetical predicted protein [Drosophila guanche]